MKKFISTGASRALQITLLLLSIIVSGKAFAQSDTALYWKGGSIWNHSDRNAAADDVLQRGFTHVVNSEFATDGTSVQWFDTKGFGVIQGISATKYNLDITPRFASPYKNPGNYEDKLGNLEDYLLSYSDNLVGIMDDIEIYPWPTKTYDADGDKTLLYGDDIEYRIGHSSAGSSWTTFIDHPSTGHHDVANLTIDNIEYNFPKLSISQTVHNAGTYLGYYAPGYEGKYDKVAQTFRPGHNRITRIDITIARRSFGAPGFPAGHVYFYLTETKPNGEPDLTKRLFEVDLRCKNTETDYDAAGLLTGVEPLSLYFDPEEHGLLDTNKTYALVLEFSLKVYSGWNNDSNWYILACNYNNGYAGGKVLRGNIDGTWHSYDSRDLWFKVYYPDPPSGWGLRQFHEDWVAFQTDITKWHIENYRNILDTVNEAACTMMELYVYSGYSGIFQDWLGRKFGNLHGGYNTRSFYSVDWDKLASSGLDYAVCGYGQKDVTETMADLDGRALLIGGAQNQSDFDDRWDTCNGGAMLWYSGGFANDPGVSVPAE